MNNFSAKNRRPLLERIHQDNFDVLVIGGGITGAGIALDAVSRGLKVCLVEMQDFAGGTSSRSTRLIHGGLRYLKQLEFKLVSEVAREREIIFKNAPHLVRPELLLLPITTTGSFGKFMTRLGMWVYETLAGIKKEERYRYLGANETLKLEPLLKKERLLGGILYYEYQTDDARLTISILKEAVNRGAIALNYIKATGFIYENGKIRGARVTDRFSGKTVEVLAGCVINAAGPWVDELDSMDNEKQGDKLQHTKGVHLVFSRSRLPLTQAVYFDSHDGRMIFALPHRNKTYVGTTDTFYKGELLDPQVDEQDKTYLLKCVNDFFKVQALSVSDIQSSWAGIRPLIKKAGKRPSEISRRDETFQWKSGLISIAGGKLTGYRKMAERVVDIIAARILKAEKKKIPACSTEKILLSGGKTGNFQHFLKENTPEGIAVGLTEEESRELISRYGSEVNKLFDIIRDLKNRKDNGSGLPLMLRAELIYAIEQEMCLTPADFFIRRTGMLYFEIDKVISYQALVLQHLRGIFNWSDDETQRWESALLRLLRNAGS